MVEYMKNLCLHRIEVAEAIYSFKLGILLVEHHMSLVMRVSDKVVALDFGGRRTAGTAAGLLDGVGYLAATLSGVGIAKVLVRSGWSLAYSAMAFLTVVAILPRTSPSCADTGACVRAPLHH